MRDLVREVDDLQLVANIAAHVEASHRHRTIFRGLCDALAARLAGRPIDGDDDDCEIQASRMCCAETGCFVVRAGAVWRLADKSVAVVLGCRRQSGSVLVFHQNAVYELEDPTDLIGECADDTLLAKALAHLEATPEDKREKWLPIIEALKKRIGPIWGRLRPGAEGEEEESTPPPLKRQRHKRLRPRITQLSCEQIVAMLALNRCIQRSNVKEATKRLLFRRLDGSRMLEIVE
jgi:hypothetical protein